MPLSQRGQDILLGRIFADYTRETRVVSLESRRRYRTRLAKTLTRVLLSSMSNCQAQQSEHVLLLYFCFRKRAKEGEREREREIERKTQKVTRREEEGAARERERERREVGKRGGR